MAIRFVRKVSALVLAAAIIGQACCVFADTPMITGLTARQRKPWNGKIDITFTVTGDVTEQGPAVLVVSAADLENGTNYVADATALSGDTGTAEGAHHVVWDLDAQGLGVKSDDVAFTVAYATAMYCVIDLSAGTNASSYPVTYLNEPPSSGFNVGAYKTTKLVLKRVEAGSFQMGGSVGVTLKKPYYIGLFEVTQKQYELVVGSNPSQYTGDTRPVEKVSYNAIRGSSFGAQWPASNAVDSSSFLGKLRSRTGLDFDLPTEAQWEYACRAGTTTTFSYGSSVNGNYMWYRSNSSNTPHEVGTKLPNAWGLFDMHGNRWEWCLDWYDEYELPEGTDPVGVSSGTARVRRGGGSNNAGNECASNIRSYGSPSNEGYDSGFRLVRTLTDGVAVGGVICSGDSVSVTIDTRTDSQMAESIDITYDASWIGGDAGATVVICDNGAEVRRTTGAGEFTYNIPTGSGRHELTYVTFVDGATQEEVYRVIAWNGEYFIHYGTNGGEGAMSTQTMRLGVPDTLSTNAFKRTGYTFNGWAKTANGEVEYYDKALVTNLTETVDAIVNLYAVWSPNHYQVRFNSGFGTGSMPNQTITYDAATALLANTFAKTGYHFAGWATEADGEAVHGDCGEALNLAAGEGDVVDLYATWAPNGYTVVFDANGGAGTMQPQLFTYDEEQALTANAFTRASRFFAGWATAANGAVTYADCAVVSNLTTEANGEVRLYAVWADSRVVFDANSGEGSMGTFFVSSGTEQTLPQGTFTKDGHFLLGWALTPNGEATLLDGDTTADLAAQAGETVTLYAVWHEGEGGGSGLSVNYYDISTSGYSTWTQSEAAMTNYFANRTPTIVTNTLAFGETLQSGFQLNNDTSWRLSEFPGLWLDKCSTNRYHAKYANQSQEHFAMLYEGSIRVDAGGEYTFGTSCDDAIVIYIDGNRVCATSNWESPSKGTIALEPESHRITIATYENGGSQGMFVEWKKPGDTSFSPLPQSVLTDGRVTTYAIRFDANGGAGTMAKRVYASGESMELPAMAFERDGWTFVGWGTEADGPVAYADGATIDGGIDAANGETTTLYARWGKDTYTIHFDASGGEGAMADESFWLGIPDTLPPSTFTRTGYTFAGWATAANGNVAHGDGAQVVDLAAEPNGEATLYAVWSPHEWTICFYSEDDFIGSQVFAYDSTEALDGNTATKTGYTFVGWATEEGGEKAYDDGEEVLNLTAEDGVVIDFYAIWTPNAYTVAFDANGGEGTMADMQFSYDVGQTLTTNAFTRENRFFAGWATAADGEVEYADGEVVSNLMTAADGEVTLYAVWADARIVFDANSGEGEVEGEMAPFFLFAGTEQTLPQGTFTMDGYFLLGWALTPDGDAALLDGDSTADIVAETGETVTLYAVWHEGESGNGLVAWYAFDGDASDSSGNGNDGVVNGATLVADRNGNPNSAYSFDGNDTIRVEDSETLRLPTNAITIAAWMKPNYASGWIIACCKAESRSSTRQYGLGFGGSSTLVLNDYNGKLSENICCNVSPSLQARTWQHVVATWNGSTMCAYMNGQLAGSGNVSGVFNVNHEDLFIGLDPCESYNYYEGSIDDLAIWNRALSANEIADLYAGGFPCSAYAVRFDANGGAGTMSKRVYAMGDDIVLPANVFTRDGWSFLGWATSADGLVAYADGEAIDGGIDAANGATVTLYARWVEEAEIRFNANGGAGSMASQSFPIGYPFDLAINGFSRVGYSFAGWATEPDGDAAYLDGETVTIEAEKGDAVDLFAVWTPNGYAVSFDPTEGAFAGTAPTMAAVFDSPYGGLPVASRTGYTLAWTLGGEAVTAETICTTPSNHTLVASWTPNEYEVSFDANGGEVGTASKTVTFGAAYGALPTPSFEWHSFRRWTLNGNRTISAESVVSTAADHTLVADWNLGIGGGAWAYPDGDGPITLGAPLVAASGDVVIPAEIDGRPIVAIGAAAFAGNTAITAITIPASVTNIADGAFAGCSGLRSVAIARMYENRLADLFPDSMGSIEEVVFGYGIEAIPDNFFEGCTALKSMDIPESVVDIGTHVFEACSELAVTVTNGLVFYQGWCLGFAGVERLNVEELNVPETHAAERPEVAPYQVRGIAAGAFEGETGIATVSLPESLRFIGARAFAGCTRLEGIAVPEGVAKIDREAFRNCTRAQELSLPESLRIIGDGAFANCTRFTGVSLPFGVEGIGGCAFSNCWRVTSVSIPQSVERVGLGAFADCENITEATVPLHVATMAELLPSAYDKLATVSVAELGDARQAPPVAYGDSPLPEGAIISGGDNGSTDKPTNAQTNEPTNGPTPFAGVSPANRQMVPGMFAGCASLEGISLPEWVCNISDGAFEGCAAIELLALPDVVTNIGARACASMAALETVKFPVALKTIGAEAFDGDAGIASLALPNGLQTIGERAFRGLSLLARADIPASVEEIGAGVFSQCGAVRAVSMPGDVATVAAVFPEAYDKITSAMIVPGDGSLGELAPPVLCAQLFAGCSALTMVELPQDLAEIGEQVFANCSALAEVGIPAAVTNIGASAFQNCSTLSSIALPRNLAAIRDGTFAGCASLAEIIIPESVGALGNGVFSGCTLLRSVRFVGNAPSYSMASGGPYAGVPSDAVSYVPDGSTGWDGIAFSQDLPRYWPNGTTYRIDWWDPTRLTVAFDPCDGTAPVEVEQVTGTSYVLPADPVRQGARFAGWWTAAENGARITASTLVTATRPHTCYAHWTMNRYFIHLDANGGSGTASPVEMTVGTAAALPPCPFAYVAHAFMGWATTPNGPVAYADGATVGDLAYANNAAVTLYAVWAERDGAMPDYLDAPGLTFETEGGGEWSGDWEEFKVGGASLASGELPPSEIAGEWTNTVLRTTVIGAGSLSFWWRVSCEPEDVDWGEWYDFATFAVDGVEVARIAGESGWRQVECVVSGEGTHVLEWTFLRDDYDEDGADYDNALWVDGVEWTPAPVTVAFAAGEGANGETPTGTAPAAVTQSAGYSLVLPGCGTLDNAPYVFTGWTDGETTYAAGDTFVFGSAGVTLTAVWELKTWTLGEAADAPAMSFATGGMADWAVDATTGWTNGVSAKSGAVANGQSSWIETTVTGGGTLAFRWKVMGGIYRNTPFAYAKVEVDGTQVASTHLTDGWEGQSLTVEGVGTHTIRWTYLRTSSRAADGDCAWLDAVVWTPEAPESIEVDGVEVPVNWLDEYPTLVEEHSGSHEAAANAIAANGVNTVAECYVAGLVPTNAADVFRAIISWKDGVPVITWEPDLNEGGTKHERVYTVEGRESLTQGSWGPTNANSHFFRVKVELK